MQWTIQNIGQARTLESSWQDAVYLSQDLILQTSVDILLESLTRNGALNSGSSYDRSVSVDIPHGVSGLYYVIVATDIGQAIDEMTEENNYNTTLSPLLHSLFYFAQQRYRDWTMLSGQPRVSGLCRIESVNRFELGIGAIYLSTDPYPSGEDLLLGTDQVTRNLVSGDSYSKALTVEIPMWLSGSYYVIVYADQSDDVYGLNGENENFRSHIVSIEVPPPSDLIVSNVQLPIQAYPSDQVEVTYTLENTGPYAAIGRLRDAIYFSSDPVWDNDDALLGYVDRDIDIPAGASMLTRKTVDIRKTYREQERFLDEGENGSLNEAMPGLLPGSYYVIVRADARNNIREVSDNNNTTSSAATIDVQIEELQLATPEIFSIDAGELRYYQLTAQPNQDIRINLSTNDEMSSAEIFVAFGMMPSLSDYDWSSAPDFDGDGSVLIPNEAGGLY